MIDFLLHVRSERVDYETVNKYTKNPLTMVFGTFMIKLYLLSDICIIRYINYIEDNEER